jgi:hypothetical protein
LLYLEVDLLLLLLLLPLLLRVLRVGVEMRGTPRDCF